MLSRKTLAVYRTTAIVTLMLIGLIAPTLFFPKVTAVTANLTEWTMPDGNTGPWGIGVDSSGKMWFTENVSNRLANLDPVTNILREWNLPNGGTDPRYVFVKSAANSVRVYFTQFQSDRVGYFDNSTGTFFIWQLPSGARPVGIGVDNQDTIWFTEAGRDAIGSITPITNTWSEFKLPATPTPAGTVQCGGQTVQLCPWGLVVQNVPTISGQNTFIWFTEITNNVVGRLEAKSHALTLFNLRTVNPFQYYPLDISLDGQGNAIFTASSVQANRIGVIRNQTNTLAEVVIPTSSAKATSIKWDSTRNLAWFAEYTAGKVTSLDTSGLVFTFLPQVIPCTIGGTNPGAPDCASGSSFSQTSVALSTTTKSNPDNLRSVTPSLITTVASQNTNQFSEFPLPTSIAGPNSVYVDSSANVWFTEQQSSGNRVARLNVQIPVALNVSANPTTVTVNQGQLANFTINVQQTSGSAVTASLSISPSPPQGVTYNFNPASGTAPFSSALQLGTTSSTPTGTYPFTVTATGGGVSAQTQINLVVTSQPVVTFDFSLAVNGPSLASITAGDTATFSMSVNPTTSAPPQTVQLFASGQPAGMSSSFAPPTGLPSFTSTLTLSSSVNTEGGTYTITITGTGGGQTHQTTVSVTVTPAPKDFAISASPASLTIPQASTATLTVSVQSTGVFSDPVNLAASNVPDGVAVSFSPNPVTPSAGGTADATVSITVTRSVARGSYSFTITGTSGSLVRQASVSVDVTGCLIATATYGSELAPEVQFLRDFRDFQILETFAGSNFMIAFNAWYYSFSPTFAGYILSGQSARTTAKVMLYPLMGILHASSATFALLAAEPEVAALVSGLVAGTLIGLVYLVLPMSAMMWFIRRRLGTHALSRAAKYLGGFLTLMIAGFAISELLTIPALMMFVSVGIVLTALTAGAALPALALVQYAARRR